MSKEEKKAIAYWKNIRDTHIAGFEGHRNAIVLLNLIEKQNKEIEELKFENILAREENDYMQKNYISKSEIREMLEEIDSCSINFDNSYWVSMGAVENILKELLGE